jgi:hypothetical protein
MLPCPYAKGVVSHSPGLRSYPGFGDRSFLLYPNGVVSRRGHRATEPRWGTGRMHTPPRPRVAAARQPWAMRHNRFAVLPPQAPPGPTKNAVFGTGRTYTIDPGLDGLDEKGPKKRCLLSVSDPAADEHFRRCRNLREC